MNIESVYYTLQYSTRVGKCQHAEGHNVDDMCNVLGTNTNRELRLQASVVRQR